MVLYNYKAAVPPVRRRRCLLFNPAINNSAIAVGYNALKIERVCLTLENKRKGIKCLCY